jgi:predicted ATPase
MVVKGQGAPDVGEVYTRAHTLCHQVGEPPQRFQVLRGLYKFHGNRAQMSTAAELSQQLLHLAHHQHDPVLVREGQMAAGSTALFRHDPVAARAHLEHSLRLCDTPRSPRASSDGDVDRVTILALLTHALWALGYADQAQQRSQEALALAQHIGHIPSLAYAETFAARLSQYCRDAIGTQTRAQALMAVAAAHGFGHRVEHGRILWGWALAMQGETAAGVADIQEGLGAVQGTGLRLHRPYGLSLLAEAYGQAGQPATGLTVLGEAVTLVATTEERWWEAELYRLQGTLLCHLPSPDLGQAEGCFRQALDVARRQQAKSLELRAAMSVSRLWQQHGKRQAAHDLLAPVYGWFTEGFDTPDLQEAKALLGALA